MHCIEIQCVLVTEIRSPCFLRCTSGDTDVCSPELWLGDVPLQHPCHTDTAKAAAVVVAEPNSDILFEQAAGHGSNLDRSDGCSGSRSARLGRSGAQIALWL